MQGVSGVTQSPSKIKYLISVSVFGLVRAVFLAELLTYEGLACSPTPGPLFPIFLASIPSNEIPNLTPMSVIFSVGAIG